MLKGEVVYVEVRGTTARVGARSEDGLMWFWTTKAPGPKRGDQVTIPPEAKPEAPKRSAAPKLPESEELMAKDVERMLRSVALKAAATVCSGLGPMAEKNVLALAEAFLAWLRADEVQL